MGMSTAGSGVAGGRRRRAKRHQPMSEINVTPFVDVMLVLLIIFMVAAPLLTVGVPIDLPESRAKPLPTQTQPISVTIRANKKIFINETPITLEKLVPKLKAIAKNGLDERIRIRGSAKADYETISKVMGELNNAGFRKMGLDSDPLQ